MATMTKNKVTDLETARQKLAQMRDELKLKIHLARADARLEWEGLETKWNRFEGKMRRTQRESEGSVEEIREDLKDLAEDLREGYERVKSSL